MIKEPFSKKRVQCILFLEFLLQNNIQGTSRLYEHHTTFLTEFTLCRGITTEILAPSRHSLLTYPGSQ